MQCVEYLLSKIFSDDFRARVSVHVFIQTHNSLNACARNCATIFLTRLFKIAARWKQWNVYHGGMKTSTVVPSFNVM